MSKKIVKTDAAPTPVGPYSQAVKVDNLLFISGQAPIDPKSNKKISGGVDKQTKQALDNIGNILKAEGLSYDNIVKVTVFLKNLNDFPKMNEVYKKYFAVDPPTRTTIQAAPPGDFDVEIDAIAHIH